MLRMGKNPKAEQPEAEHQPDTQQAAQTTAYQTPQQSYQPQGHQSQSQQSPSLDAQYRAQVATNAATTRAVSESEALAREIKDGTLSGFVGNGTVLTGEANFKGMLRVDGHLSGRVSSDGGTLIVGNNGHVDANIEVAVATIHGTVNGDIVATQRLELGRAAKVNGNIQTPSLVIEQGAVFEGCCRMTAAREAQTQTRNAAGTATTRGANGKGDALDASTMQPVTDATDASTAAS